MGLVFRTTSIGQWGGGKLSNLTPVEVDQNFWYLLSLYNAINDHLASVAVGIASIDPVGVDQFLITMTDSTTFGPFTIPTSQWSDRGDWTPLTSYAVNDVINNGGSVYLVLYPHTSAALFDPGAVTAGHDDYKVLITLPGNVLPTGGSIGMQLYKSGTGDFAVSWQWPYLANMHDVAFGSPHNVNDVVTWDGSFWTNKPVTISAPTTFTLGGVFATAGIATQFAYGIDTSGDLLLQQPHFTDIAGTVAASQLPNPSTSTLGGVEAIAAVSGKFVASISAAGAPALGFPLQVVKQTVTQSGASLTIDHSAGEVCVLSLTATITSMTITSPFASGTQTKILLEVDNTGAFNITGWPSGTITPSGSFPTVTSGSSKKDRYQLTSWDAGTTWFLDVVGQDYHS